MKMQRYRRGVCLAAILAGAATLAGCSSTPARTDGGQQQQPASAYRHPLRGNFTPERPYDPQVDVPMRGYAGDPTQYTRHWDAETHGGTGVYEPWRDPMWTPRDDVGVLGGW